MSLRNTFVFCAALAVMAPAGFVPARHRDGPLPPIQLQALGGGEVLLEVGVNDNGGVTEVRILRETPPFTEAVTNAVSLWHFIPAEEELEPGPGELRDPKPRKHIASKVLVAALFRPPTFNTPTFGELPKDVRSASTDVPFPTAIRSPQYPPSALFGGVVLIEVRVGTDGRVIGDRVIYSVAPFDEPSREAARQWTFRPASIDGTPTETFAYIVFGFRQPVTVVK